MLPSGERGQSFRRELAIKRLRPSVSLDPTFCRPGARSVPPGRHQLPDPPLTYLERDTIYPAMPPRERGQPSITAGTE